ncbi:MAG: DNRLRE domain-containing protein, partial [Chitinivibrionales bacterium]|nr:DNRLRE domain-containing protein [Chitinivibrionales bacterium]
GAGQWVEIDVTPLVNEWLDGTHTNKGMLLRLVSGSTTHKFRSRECVIPDERPELVVVVSGTSRTLYPQADTYLEESTYQGFGDSEELRIAGSSRILLRFDLSSISASSITSATLRLYDFQQYSGTAELGVFRLDHGHEQPDAVPQIGLAAQYPNDSGIQDHADVYFFCNFESANWQDEWSSVSPSGNYTRLDSDPANNFEPFMGNAVRARLNEGNNYGGSIIYKFQQETGSEPEEIYWRYYMRFGENWNPTVSGGKLPGISGTYGVAGWGGRPVHGDDGWSARGNFGTQLSPDNPLRKKNPIGYYCYHLDMEGDYGHTWRWQIGYRGYLENNRWYCIEQYVKMNDPDQHNGILRGWVDGFLAFEKTDLSFRTVNTLKVEQVWMNLYHGGSAVSPVNMDQYYDNVVIAKQYIGPVAEVSKVKTPAEANKALVVRPVLRNGMARVLFDGITNLSGEIIHIQLYNSAGKVVRRTLVKDGAAEIPVKNLAPGLYYCKINGNNRCYCVQFPITVTD